MSTSKSKAGTSTGQSSKPAGRASSTTASKHPARAANGTAKKGSKTKDPTGTKPNTHPDSRSESQSEIERDIEQTRAQLGQTVEELAQKADVPARVKHAVRETSETVQARASEVKDHAQAAAAKATTTVTAKGQELGHQVAEKLPPQVRERVDHGVERATTVARQRPVPTAAVVTSAVLLIVVLLRVLRGRR
jgi:Protein of unknown function (DUF3618)